MVDLLTYIILVWVELTVFAVILPIIGILALGRYARVPMILNWLRTKYIYHYLRTLNGRLVTKIVLDKDVKTFGKTKFIPYKGFWYKLRDDCLFLTNTNLSIAHDFNNPEPLKFTDAKNVFFASTDKEHTKEYSSQETESAIEAKVVLDLNKSIYTNKDIIILVLIAFVGAISAINLYFNYENGQELTNLVTYLSHYFSGTGTTTPAP